MSARADIVRLGLFKKVLLADNLAVSRPSTSRLPAAALSLFPAWIAAVGFTLQIYFDFSGYSDMALGLARFFGIRLPPNFDSPLRASSIIDFWLRWHMTLTRFLTAYIYNPMALALSAAAASEGQIGSRRSLATPGGFFSCWLPPLSDDAISGVWHGAGYLFILWGLLHGVYLISTTDGGGSRRPAPPESRI